ncbi:hypothetical protein [Zunongwangia endophytica]|uniref:Multidrug transporter n=1 Tax=Zunongwangia endophytica TaxID=1808945 RepID=A0ABV8H2F0_9FLAO|nr:hypothetical protein [Zunongwangia endophytica]MDN3596199.1 hypothetical protein [Zunongwangia endophytica]
MKKLKLFYAFFALALLLTSCSSDDDNNLGTDDDTPVVTDDDGGAVEEKDDVIDSQDDPDFDPEDLKGEVRADVTITADTEWMLTGALEVMNGATLTIEPGVTINALAGGTNVYIAIAQGAKIDAQGTADSPIMITSAAENPRSGDWGGVMLAGYAQINSGDVAETEVAGISYGGDDDTDNSGIIDYMILEYTGARINGDQEFNGFTFYGVGSGTSISNIMVRYGDDDGIEWFGGTVDVTNALVVNAKDDWFDWTEGWTGNGKNFYGIREFGFNDVTEDPRGIEADSNQSNRDASPRSNPTIDGLTLYHQSTINMADMIKIRRGSSATITNAIVAIFAAEDEDAGTASDFIDLTDDAGDGSSETSINVTALGGIDATAIKDAGATDITVEAGNTGADVSVFAWTGYDFPSLGSEDED